MHKAKGWAWVSLEKTPFFPTSVVSANFFAKFTQRTAKPAGRCAQYDHTL